jgi:hypothetical protein
MKSSSLLLIQQRMLSLVFLFVHSADGYATTLRGVRAEGVPFE